MYKFVSSTGEIVKTKTIKEFATKHGMLYQTAKELASGIQATALGWCTFHPKAKKKRERFQTILVNTLTGEKRIIGESLNKFAEKYNLGKSALNRLVNGHVACYRGWVLNKTYEIMCSHGPINSSIKIENRKVSGVFTA